MGQRASDEIYNWTIDDFKSQKQDLRSSSQLQLFGFNGFNRFAGIYSASSKAQQRIERAALAQRCHQQYGRCDYGSGGPIAFNSFGKVQGGQNNGQYSADDPVNFPNIV